MTYAPPGDGTSLKGEALVGDRWAGELLGGRPEDLDPDGSIWIVGSDNAPYQWNGEGWDKRPGSELTALAVGPAGVLWATNSRQQTLRSTTAMGTRPPTDPPSVLVSAAE